MLLQGVVARLKRIGTQGCAEDSEVGQLVLEDLLEATTDVGAKTGSGEGIVVEQAQSLRVERGLEEFQVRSKCEDLKICVDIICQLHEEGDVWPRHTILAETEGVRATPARLEVARGSCRDKPSAKSTQTEGQG